MNDKNSFSPDFYTSLSELGLSQLEINLYTISLQLGPSPISLLAKYMGISRPNVYKVIEGLRDKGLASFYGQEKYARKFMVESPSIVLEKLRKKGELLKGLDGSLTASLPDLLAFYQQGGKDTKIKVIKNQDQFLKIFHQSLEETRVGGMMEFFGSASDFISFVGWQTEREWIKGRLKKKISIRTLVSPDKDAATLRVGQEKELREVRLYNGEANFPTSFLIYGNKLVIWQPKAPLAVSIEDEYMAVMFKSIFYTLWEKSK
ncbi:MAG: hypothetical protein A2589_00530 [Candidatus Vogelbacteria bacterium RIFOXYD1_FULL_46_19]|uniref:Transcription regulator TrmB N-terminal domain-containing protein n=1 Tax=Candidatus Vogelbacteria bacterium RIFOXYD1_FULL_46_19 TaxID=1802439 RepID=A0A1G2QJN1_9BACT|nr:MAG: hypothetical protein A2589_00530 [Candidatus Vogelbacteria bacterium RIFOXYD1_FULL_46_19]